MDKILVSLFVPLVQEKYDLFVPVDLDVGSLTSVLANSVQDLCNGRYSVSGKERLIRTLPDAVLDPLKTFSEYDINDGTELMLI